MSTLLNLFKASKKLYEDFEYSRLLTVIPFFSTYKAFKLDDHQVPDPREDSAIKEFIQKLAQDPEVESSTRLKNLVKILHLCISATDTITLETSLTDLRIENRALYGTLPFHSEYTYVLDEFINHQILLAQHAEALAKLQQEIESKDYAYRVLALERDQLEQSYKTAESKYEAEMEDNIRLIQEKLGLEQTLKTSVVLNDQAFSALRLKLEAGNKTSEELFAKKMQYEVTIAGLRRDIAKLDETIEELEGTISDKDNEHDKTKYELSVLTRAHQETTSKLKESEATVANLKMKLKAQAETFAKGTSEIMTRIAQAESNLASINQGIETQCQKLEIQLADAITRADGLQKVLVQANADTISLKAEHEAQLADLVAQGKETHQMSEASLAQATAQIAKLQKQLEKANIDITKFKIHEDELKVKIESLQEQYKKVLDTNARIQKDSAQKSKDAKADKDLLESRLKTSTKEFTTKIKDLQTELAELTEAKSQLQTKTVVLQHELDKANVAITAATRKSKDLGQTVERLRDKLKQSEVSQQQLAEANKILQGSYEALHSDHQILSANAGAESTSAKQVALHVTQIPQAFYNSRKSGSSSSSIPKPSQIKPASGMRP